MVANDTVTWIYMACLEGGLRPQHMATHRADQGMLTFSLSNFTCVTQEALSDRARGPEFIREKVTMTQMHQFIGGMHR